MSKTTKITLVICLTVAVVTLIVASVWSGERIDLLEIGRLIGAVIGGGVGLRLLQSTRGSAAILLIALLPSCTPMTSFCSSYTAAHVEVAEGVEMVAELDGPEELRPVQANLMRGYELLGDLVDFICEALDVDSSNLP